LTAAYSCNLRAYLLTPDEEKPIKSLQDLFESHLPWDMVDYGAITGILEHSLPNDPLKKFVDEKETASYSNYIFDRVTQYFSVL